MYSILSCAETLLIWKKILSILNLPIYVHFIKHSALFKFFVRIHDVVLRHKRSFMSTCSVFIGGTVGSVMIVLLGDLCEVRNPKILGLAEMAISSSVKL
jgi:hypothetical protein